VAAAPVGLGSVADVLFRFDCRAADPGCTMAAAAGSWGGRGTGGHPGHGPAQRAIALLASTGVILLALEIRRRPAADPLGMNNISDGIPEVR
jgi:hypothetical protein